MVAAIEVTAGGHLEVRSGFDVGSLIGSLDEIATVDGFGEGDGVGIASGGFAIVRGWAFDASRKCSADQIALSINSGSSVTAFTGLARPDVAAVHGPAAATCGFIAAVPILVGLGRHALVLQLRSGEAEHSIAFADAVVVVPAPDPFARWQPRPGDWRCAVDGLFTPGGALLSRGVDGLFIAPDELAGELRLWVLDAARLAPAHSLLARFGGRHLRVRSTIRRDDVARAEGMPGAEMCGFSIPLVPTPVGTEQVEIYAFDHDGGYARLLSIRVRRPDPLPSDILPPSAAVRWAIDEMTIDGAPLVGAKSPQAVAGGDVHIRGWVVDTFGPRLSGGVEILIDDRALFELQTSQTRTDVAREFGTLGVVACGFEAHVALPPLSPGMHYLTVRALSARRDARAQLERRAFRVPA